MKKLIYLVSLLCSLHINASQSSIPATLKSPIPKEFTVLHSKAVTEKDPLEHQEKADCFFYILVSAPTPATITAKAKENPLDKKELYKSFVKVTKEQQGTLIPKDFIKPGIPEKNTPATHILHYGWNDTGSKNTLIHEASAFNKALVRLHQKNKKSSTCYYLIVTEGRSGLLVNYATHLPLQEKTLSLSVVVEIGTPLPGNGEKGNKSFYPDLFKIGTMYSLYTQHAYKPSTVALFPPSPQMSYSKPFIHQHTNLYNIRLLLNNNQRSLQNIFEEKNLNQPLAYLGQHIFEYCNLIKRTYQQHHDLWATLDTRANSKPFIGIVSHQAQEKPSSKAIKKEHQHAGKQLEDFNKTIGSSTRINMSDRAKLQSKVRPIAQLRKKRSLASPSFETA